MFHDVAFLHFRAHLPNVTYLRLDGSVTASERHKIVTSFNEDPSIDVLLLTTHIGGLGLNLTGADTVSNENVTLYKSFSLTYYSSTTKIGQIVEKRNNQYSR